MRALDELRAISFELGVQTSAEGSCLVKVGGTHVLCAATLEEKVPGWMKGKGSGWITAEYGMLPRATDRRTDREATRGKQQGRTVEIQRLIGRSLRQAVDLKALGERTITVDCDVLNADGGTRCASITGAWVALALALRKAGLEAAISHQISAVSVGILEDGSGRRGLALDLEYVEDRDGGVDCNVVACRPMAGGELCLVEFQGTGESRAFTRSEAIELVDLGLSGCLRLMNMQLEVLV